MLSHSVKHSFVHFGIDVGLGVVGHNSWKEILIESSFFTFVSLCFNLEEFLNFKLFVSVVFLLVLIFSNVNYHQLDLNNLHHVCHELLHLVLGVVLQLCNEFSVYSLFVGLVFYFSHLAFQSKGWKACRVAFGVLVFLHVLFYFCVGQTFYAYTVEL